MEYDNQSNKKLKSSKTAYHRRNKELILDSLLESTESVICYFDIEYKLMLINRKGLENLGWSKEYAKDKTLYDMFPKEAADYYKQRLDECLKIEEGCTSENFADFTDGKRWFLTDVQPVRNQKGKIIGIQTISTDITERKKAENLVRIQRDLAIATGQSSSFQDVLYLCLKAVLEASEMDSGGIYTIDPVSGTLDLLYQEGFTKEFAAAVVHYAADSPSAQIVMAGNPVYSTHKKLGVPLNKAKDKEELKGIAVVPLKHANRIVGSLNVASHTYEEVPQFARNTLETIASQIGDAIANRQANEALKKSEEKWRSFAENAPVMITHINREGLIQFINYVAQEIGVKAEDVLGKKALDFTAEQYRAKTQEVYKRVLKTGITESYEMQGALSGKWYYSTVGVLKQNNCIIGLTVINVDITKQKQAEKDKEVLMQQISYTEKMSSMGKLAGGMAHEVNNPLTSILSTAELILEELPVDATGEIKKDIEQIIRESKRIGETVKSFLGFARSRDFVLSQTKLNKIIDSALGVVGRGRLGKVKVVKNYAENVEDVKISRFHIEEVFVNLISNALYSMEDAGTLTITTKQEDNEVMVSVRDTGQGIKKENLEKIFEPYFTTKEGMGTGLGLATCVMEIYKHNGRIEVESEGSGKGAEFKIYLPNGEEK